MPNRVVANSATAVLRIGRMSGNPEQLGQIQDAQADVAGLVALEVGHELAQHRLDVGGGHGAKQVDRDVFDQKLHAEQLVGQVRGRQKLTQHRLRVAVERRQLDVEL